jgi:hypothetical protein
MTTSGSFAFDPSVASFLDEAFERAGLDPISINERHIRSAKASLNYMFIEWVTQDGDALYRVANSSSTVAAATTYFSPPAGTVDLLDMVQNYNSSGTDIPISRASREDYLNTPLKTTTGRPVYYYVDMSNLNAPRVYLWPIPDATIIFTYDYMRWMNTVASMGETLDLQHPWLEAAVAGLAWRMAAKYNPDRVAMLKPLADNAYRIARRSGSGNSRVVIASYGFGTPRYRRR